MTQHRIPKDVRQFVLSCIPSIPFLEATLLLRSRSPGGCSARQLAVALYLSERAARHLLDALCASGFARYADETCVYAPRDAATALAVDRLSQVYADDLVGITTLIHEGDRNLRAAGSRTLDPREGP